MLVCYDALGMTGDVAPSFAKRYSQLGSRDCRGHAAYAEEVKDGRVPGAAPGVLIVARTIAQLHQRLAAHRTSRIGPTIGLVPTMGALHAGHGSLIEASVHENEYTVVSNFVNPSQFNDPADFARYPRDLATDNAFCESLGADLVFAPSVEEMYPREQQAFVDVGRVTQHLEGQGFRPGHFRGVATVVMKLLQIVQPSRVCFGEKDAQQLAMIQRMVEDAERAGESYRACRPMQ